jgi:ATP-binding cassette subfamily B multidrug efflux pump
MFALFRLARPYRGRVGLILLLALIQSLANLFLPRLMGEVVDHGIVTGDTAAIVRTGALMLLMALGATACAVAGSYHSAQVATGLGRIVRGEVFSRVARYSVHQFAERGSASLVTRTTNDTAQVQQMLIMLLNTVITAPMMAMGGVLLALSQDATLAGVLLVVIPVVGAVFLVIMRGAIPLFQVMQTRIDRLNLVLEEGLSGVRVIRAFDRNADQHARFDDANIAAMDTAVSVNRLVAFLMPSLMVMLNLTAVAIIYVGGQQVDAGAMDVGVMISSLQYATQILFAVFMVTALFIMFPRASASAARINEVLDQRPEVADAPQTRTHAPATPPRGRVTFEHVTFQYPGAEEPAVADISFEARPGEVTAIIGGTGSGKSTIAGLIPRFYDVHAGRVLIDGIDVRDLPLDALRARIGFVPQQATLFTGTIAANIRYGREDASDEEVRHAAEVAQALEFIRAMPDGFEAQVSQGGTNLSGGQKQRLAIARALVRRPDIYVFDDSSSALDVATDARLRAALASEVAHSAVVVVSQRISTVMHADRIVVLDNGRVAGVGTHADLVERCAVYREIVDSQVSLEDVA